MDHIHQGFTANFALNASKNLDKVFDIRAGHSISAALQLDSHGVSSHYFSNSKGSKREWRGTDGMTSIQDVSSLVLGLGGSSSSCINLSSGKEIEEESPLDLGLSINLYTQNGKMQDLKNISQKDPKAVEAEIPKLDLELSLSMGAAESDVTSVTQGSIIYQNSAETQVVAGSIQHVDEGSTSSRWKLGPLVPPLRSTDTTTSLRDACNDVAPFITNSSNVEVIPQSSVSCASGAVHLQPQRNSSVKTCQFDGCTRGARGASGLCIAHGGGRRCQRAGCQRGAEGKTVFCKAHGGGRRCQHLGCTKSAEGRTDFCIGHGGGRRCSHEGCTRAARGKSGLCIRHGGGKRCKIENCTKSAEGISGLCISHGGGRRCLYPACTKGAQGSTMFCKAHGGGKRCTILGCTKGAEGSTPLCKGHGGGKRCTFEGGCSRSVHGGTLFCVNHGGGKRCAMPGCSKSARGRTNFCVRHGGGKRCKFEGCTKSAQGSTHFCKAHGGGKRCSWGQMGSEFGAYAAFPCDKFARGKSGLCAAHAAQLQEMQINGGRDKELHGTQSTALEEAEKVYAAELNHAYGVTAVVNAGTSTHTMGFPPPLLPMHNLTKDHILIGDPHLSEFSLPEGRVHGGSLMAILKGSISFGPSTNNQIVSDSSEPGKSSPAHHCWM